MRLGYYVILKYHKVLAFTHFKMIVANSLLFDYNVTVAKLENNLIMLHLTELQSLSKCINLMLTKDEIL